MKNRTSLIFIIGIGACLNIIALALNIGFSFANITSITHTWVTIPIMILANTLLIIGIVKSRKK